MCQKTLSELMVMHRQLYVTAFTLVSSQAFFPGSYSISSIFIKMFDSAIFMNQKGQDYSETSPNGHSL